MKLFCALSFPSATTWAMCKEEVLSTHSTDQNFSQKEQAGKSLLGLQCNSLQPLCLNLENCHSESLEDSLFMFSPDYMLLRKMDFRQQIGLLSKKSSIVFFHLQRFGQWSGRFSDFPDPFFCSSRTPLSFSLRSKHRGTLTCTEQLCQHQRLQQSSLEREETYYSLQLAF